jgi:Bacteriophage lambda head decoration protein D
MPPATSSPRSEELSPRAIDAVLGIVVKGSVKCTLACGRPNLGKVTASGKYKAFDPAAVDGSEAAAGILYDPVDASAADIEGVAIVRPAEANAAELVWPEGITAPEQATVKPLTTAGMAAAQAGIRRAVLPGVHAPTGAAELGKNGSGPSAAGFSAGRRARILQGLPRRRPALRPRRDRS